jgi:endonuclease YncB( thermonuclease family)
MEQVITLMRKIKKPRKSLAIGLMLLVLIVVSLLLGIIQDNDAKELLGEIAGIESPSEELYFVQEVIDGDTIRIQVDGSLETVRLIGIDTPERGDCLYSEAKNHLSELIFHTYIRTQGDNTQSEKDRFGRYLFYVWLDDVLINEKMILNGFAHEYTYNHPYRYQERFKEAERTAREQAVGLWGDICSDIDNRDM